tara:strand:- start:78 stop:779 length:702 start_codon:yes stop_codon:yes gene_type:complete
MSKVQPHPFDEGKYQSTFDDYGHGKGNGKSRNAIYKHAKKIQNRESETVKIETQTEDIAQNQEVSDEIPIWTNDDSTEPQEFEEWGSVEWDGEEVDVTPHTIPEPISRLNATKAALDYESMGKLVRFGFIGLDRMITHWGRGVMNKPDWSLKRSKQDYDVLESSTVDVMHQYGINIPVSPLAIWGITVSAAYAPPINHIRKNADPNRKKRIFKWPFRRKKKKEEVVKNDINEY